jgi:hypothetical protein
MGIPRTYGSNTDNIHIPLVVLSLSTDLNGLKSPALGNREPLNGEKQTLTLLQDHTSKGRSHLRTKGDLVVFLILF